jgi:hypothetical protein
MELRSRNSFEHGGASYASELQDFNVRAESTAGEQCAKLMTSRRCWEPGMMEKQTRPSLRNPTVIGERNDWQLNNGHRGATAEKAVVAVSSITLEFAIDQ